MSVKIKDADMPKMSVIIKDVDMPKTWDDCCFNNGRECCVIDAVCSDETVSNGEGIPDFCPLEPYREDS